VLASLKSWAPTSDGRDAICKTFEFRDFCDAWRCVVVVIVRQPRASRPRSARALASRARWSSRVFVFRGRTTHALLRPVRQLYERHRARGRANGPPPRGNNTPPARPRASRARSTIDRRPNSAPARLGCVW
jgi:hypothetical protein